MSRIAKNPITVPSGCDVKVEGQSVTVKGGKGELKMGVHPSVAVEYADGVLSVKPLDDEKQTWAMAGTMRSLLNNMIIGSVDGFERKLTLVGVGYRAQAKGKVLNLSLGFSHPIDYELPDGVTVATPSATEIVLNGCDKQVLGQAAAEIRAFRPPEPYKGKGVRYSDEQVVRKEAKKK